MQKNFCVTESQKENLHHCIVCNSDVKISHGGKSDIKKTF